MSYKSTITLASLVLVATLATACNKQVASCADRTSSVKATWDQAPAGVKKDAALAHFKDAGIAAMAKDEKACIAALDATLASLK